MYIEFHFPNGYVFGVGCISRPKQVGNKDRGNLVGGGPGGEGEGGNQEKEKNPPGWNLGRDFVTN